MSTKVNHADYRCFVNQRSDRQEDGTWVTNPRGVTLGVSRMTVQGDAAYGRQYATPFIRFEATDPRSTVEHPLPNIVLDNSTHGLTIVPFDGWAAGRGGSEGTGIDEIRQALDNLYVAQVAAGAPRGSYSTLCALDMVQIRISSTSGNPYLALVLPSSDCKRIVRMITGLTASITKSNKVADQMINAVAATTEEIPF